MSRVFSMQTFKVQQVCGNVSLEVAIANRGFIIWPVLFITFLESKQNQRTTISCCTKDLTLQWECGRPRQNRTFFLQRIWKTLGSFHFPQSVIYSLSHNVETLSRNYETASHNIRHSKNRFKVNGPPRLTRNLILSIFDYFRKCLLSSNYPRLFQTICPICLNVDFKKEPPIVWKFCDCLGLSIIYPFNRSFSENPHFNK